LVHVLQSKCGQPWSFRQQVGEAVIAAVYTAEKDRRQVVKAVSNGPNAGIGARRVQLSNMEQLEVKAMQMRSPKPQCAIKSINPIVQ
jgi:hypothetical protein